MAEFAVFTVLTFAATWAAWLVSAHVAAIPRGDWMARLRVVGIDIEF
jgi:hypothetical protein